MVVCPCVHHKTEGPKKNWQDKWLWVNRNLVGFGYPCRTTFSDRKPQLWGASDAMVQALRTISFNGDDWEDCMLATVGMSIAYRACGNMPQFFMEKDGECASPSPLIYIYRLGEVGGFVDPLMYVIFFVADHERIIPFKMVLQGRFQGNCQYREVPLVEILPPPISTDPTLALVVPDIIVVQGSNTQADQELVDVPVEGLSREDPLPPDLEDDPSKELATGGSCSTTRLARLPAY